MLPATVAARRMLLTASFGGFVRGAALATAGLLVSTGVGLIAAEMTAVEPWQIVVGAAALYLTYDGRVHPGLVVIGGALAGLALAR
jgi:chromate transport protein ChrA